MDVGGNIKIFLQIEAVVALVRWRLWRLHRVWRVSQSQEPVSVRGGQTHQDGNDGSRVAEQAA